MYLSIYCTVKWNGIEWKSARVPVHRQLNLLFGYCRVIRCFRGEQERDTECCSLVYNGRQIRAITIKNRWSGEGYRGGGGGQGGSLDKITSNEGIFLNCYSILVPSPVLSSVQCCLVFHVSCAWSFSVTVVASALPHLALAYIS